MTLAFMVFGNSIISLSMVLDKTTQIVGGFDRITIDTDKNRVKWTSSSMDKFPCIRTSINFNYDLKNDKINLYNNNYIKNVSIVDFSDARLTLEGYQ